MIQTIIFDIGQVLARFRWQDYLMDLGFEGRDYDRVARATVLGPYWDEVDRGVLSMHQIIEKCVCLDRGIEDKIRLFYKDRSNLVTEFDYSKDLLRGLKENGYRIYLLSNYGEENFEYIRDRFSFFDYTDGMVISYEIKSIKPEPEIYEALIDKYKLDPKECVFLDDRKENLDAAEKFGFETILFTGLEAAKESLCRLGVNV